VQVTGQFAFSNSRRTEPANDLSFPSGILYTLAAELRPRMSPSGIHVDTEVKLMLPFVL